MPSCKATFLDGVREVLRKATAVMNKLVQTRIISRRFLFENISGKLLLCMLGTNAEPLNKIVN